MELGRRRPQISGESSGFRSDVQGLRAIAVGAVVLAHAGVPGAAGGFVGVDVFFVISGFLITGLLLKDVAGGRIRMLHFYQRRALRILPAATVVIVVTALASLWVFGPTRANEVLADAVWSSVFLANVKFGIDGTDYFNNVAVSPLQHYWSLSVEEQFYVVWPALLAVVCFGVVARARRRAVDAADIARPVPRLRIALVLALAGIASFVWALVAGTGGVAAVYFSTPARAWELIAGALLATAGPQIATLGAGVRAALSWSGLLGIVAAVLLFDGTTPFPGTATLLPILATAAVLAGGAGRPTGSAQALLSVRPMRFVGDISYSLYLWHWPLLIIGAEYFGDDRSALQTLGLVAAMLILSTLSYRLVENPSRRAGARWRLRPIGEIAVSWVAAVAVVLAVVGVGQLGWFGGSAGSRVVAADMPAGPAEVASSAAEAVAGAVLPNNLSPTLEKLRDDETNIGECSGYKRTSNTVCAMGAEKSDHSVVLFGNSHAVAWIPAMDGVAARDEWRMYPFVKEACDLGSYAGTSTRNKQCGVWYRWALGQIRALHPDVIVIQGYYSGSDWREATVKLIDDLRSTGAEVIVLSDPPGLDRRPQDCLEKRSVTLDECMLRLSNAKLAADRDLARIAAAADVRLVNVRPWFCADRICPAVIGNRIVYADFGHLTRTYALHLVPLLQDALALD